MAKDKLTEYDATAANNTVVGDVNLAENSALPSDMNNAVREVMSHQKEAFGSGTPLYVDQTNNRVGIGNSAPSTALEVDAAGATVLTVDRATSDGDIITIQQDGSTVGTLGAVGDDVYLASPSGSDAGIRLGNNIIRPCTTTGGSRDNAIDLGKSDTRFKDLYLGGGAYIGGTGAANYLDDIEEGTFTATLNGGTGHPSTRLTTTGYYTKVNQMVHIGINFNNVTTTSYSGQISVFGLPFACGEPGRQVFTVGAYNIATFSSSVGSVFAHLSVGGTEPVLLGIRSANSWEEVTHSAGAARYLQINGVYRAS